ncbi:aldehyde dehydrogenase family protein [Streptomyces sp. RGM 3693]|uniref:aldehyde dehydrogenase family protein n=1 Tax=Streptomyces sp. RGM 3693 TaxID=3413284 RepID=UPI003D292220
MVPGRALGQPGGNQTCDEGAGHDGRSAAATRVSAPSAELQRRPLGPIRRAAHLTALGRQLAYREEEFTAAITREQGKLRAEARAEVARARAVLEFTAGQARLLGGVTAPAEEDRTFAYTFRRPLGVVGLVSPWNFPLAIPVWKVAPALLSGCTAVLKPSQLTPLTAALLTDAAQRAGGPDCVLNLVQGDAAAGAALVADPRVAGISFTVSLAVGTAIHTAGAPQHLLRQPERQRYPGAPHAVDHRYPGLRLGHQLGAAVPQRRVTAGPALGDPRVRDPRELPQRAEDRLVDLLTGERVVGGRVRMAVADRQPAVRGLGQQHVDAVLPVERQLRAHPGVQRRAGRAVLERCKVQQGQPAAQHRPELPAVRLRPRPQHLELAAHQPALPEHLRIAGGEVVAAAHHDPVGPPFAVGGGQPRRRDPVVGGDHQHRAERVQPREVAVEHGVEVVCDRRTGGVLVLDVVAQRQVHQVRPLPFQYVHARGQH